MSTSSGTLNSSHDFFSRSSVVSALSAKVTTSRFLGFLVGAFATAVIQSSSAVTALTVALVDSGVITFGASLSVLLGSNVGTTATAWLVSFKLTSVGPIFIVLGALVSVIPGRFSVGGKALFYFGLILFALNLVSSELEPLREQQWFVEWMTRAQKPLIGVLVGALFTALVQSSSVTTGVAIILVQQNALPAVAAIPIVLGANVGSTTTALVASRHMEAVAKATAKANFAFNLLATLIFFPFLGFYSRAAVALTDDAAMAVAWAHLGFNIAIAAVFLPVLGWISSRFAPKAKG